jgi:hypothetical protein
LLIASTPSPSQPTTSRVAGDLLDEKTRMVWDGLYEHYVPLRGWAEPSLEGEFIEGGRSRSGSGFDIRGQESKRAMGRTSKAGDILAHVLTQHEEAVIRAEKNRVAKTFLRLAQQNPNPSLWEISEKKLRRTIDKETGQVTLTPDPLGNRMDNVLAVKVGGDVFHITIHDPNLARNMKNLGAESMDFFIRALAKFNRYLAFINTSLNPEFVISNFSRDIQTAGVNLQGIESAKGLTTKIMRDVPKALAGAYGAIRSNKRDTECSGGSVNSRRRVAEFRSSAWRTSRPRLGEFRR